MSAETPRAFFSYSRLDSEFALKLAKDLRRAGAAVWLDQLDISPGEHWDSAVEKALASFSTMLLVLSPSSVESKNVMDEVSFALEENKLVIPVLYGDCKIPFRLRRLQHIDIRVDYEKGLGELLRTLGVVPKAKSAAVAASPTTSREETPVAGTQTARDAIEKANRERIRQERAEAERRATERSAAEVNESRRTLRPSYLIVVIGLVVALGLWGALRKTTIPSDKNIPVSVHPEGPNLQTPSTGNGLRLDSTAWVTQFLRASEGPDVDRLRTYFDDVVSPYYSMPSARWDVIENDKRNYFLRFPTIHYALVGQPTDATGASGGDVLEFEFEYSTVRNDGQTLKGRSHITMNVTSVDGQWRIAGISERKVTE